MNDSFAVLEYLNLPSVGNYSSAILLDSVFQHHARATKSNKIVISVFNSKADDLCSLSVGFKSWYYIPNYVLILQYI